MVFEAEQKAVGGSDIGAHQHGPAVLEDFIQRSDIDVPQRGPQVVGTGLGHGILEDVVNRADGHGDIDKIAEKFLDATHGTVADERQAQGCLPQPRFGDR